VSDPLSVGEHPRERPDDRVGPCPSCVGNRAQQAVHDAVFDLKYGRAFPVDSREDFEDEFAGVITRMAMWCYGEARAAALRDDHDYCVDHEPKEIVVDDE